MLFGAGTGLPGRPYPALRQKRLPDHDQDLAGAGRHTAAVVPARRGRSRGQHGLSPQGAAGDRRLRRAAGPRRGSLRRGAGPPRPGVRRGFSRRIRSTASRFSPSSPVEQRRCETPDGDIRHGAGRVLCQGRHRSPHVPCVPVAGDPPRSRKHAAARFRRDVARIPRRMEIPYPAGAGAGTASAARPLTYPRAMCGIHGIINLDGAPADAALMSAMGGVTVHRGPDDEGAHADGPCVIGMRRLSIIDLAGGHQPLSNEDGSLWTVCNGEIYNFRELRRELEPRGHRFRTGSDSEVILHGYAEWGDAFLHRLNGMYGFALRDARRRRLLVGRDRLGVKPIYVYRDARRLAFASEAKALLALPGIRAAIDPAAL